MINGPIYITKSAVSLDIFKGPPDAVSIAWLYIYLIKVFVKQRRTVLFILLLALKRLPSLRPNTRVYAIS